MAIDFGVRNEPDRLHHVPAEQTRQELTGVTADIIVEREYVDNLLGGLREYLINLADMKPYRRDPRLRWIVEQGHGWQLTGEFVPEHNYYRFQVRVDCPAELWTLACLKF
jgi:hypothetical protein